MSLDADVAIIGAGPAGCAAAIRLGTQGHRVLLIDRATFPRDKPCGDYCDPGAAAALEELGCLPAVLKAGAAPIGGMRIVAHDGTEIYPAFPSGRGLLIRRVSLDMELVRAAARAGVEVIEGTRVQDMHIDAERVTLQLDRPPGTLTAALAIACDGIHSTVGRKLRLLGTIVPRRYTVGAYFSGLDGSPQGELHLGRGQYCGVARFGGGLANVCMALPRSHLPHRTAEGAFRIALSTFPRLADELASAQRETPFRAAGPIGFRASRMVAHRLLLAGDAAAQIDPMTGQGIAFALRSGILAAEAGVEAFSAGDFSIAHLAAYAQAWQKVFGPRLRMGRVLQSLALRPRLTPWLLRRLRARPSLASVLVGVTGDILPPEAIVNAGYLSRLLVGHDADVA